jgi:hypothetical protein
MSAVVGEVQTHPAAATELPAKLRASASAAQVIAPRTNYSAEAITRFACSVNSV